MEGMGFSFEHSCLAKPGISVRQNHSRATISSTAKPLRFATADCAGRRAHCFLWSVSGQQRKSPALDSDRFWSVVRNPRVGGHLHQSRRAEQPAFHRGAGRCGIVGADFATAPAQWSAEYDCTCATPAQSDRNLLRARRFRCRPQRCSAGTCSNARVAGSCMLRRQQRHRSARIAPRPFSPRKLRATWGSIRRYQIKHSLENEPWGLRHKEHHEEGFIRKSGMLLPT